MSWLFTSVAEQTINPGESAVFTENPVSCNSGLVRHRDGSGSFLFAGRVRRCRCGCLPKTANYLVNFGANIAIPTGGTVEPITVAISIDGATMPASTMEATPAAVDQYSAVAKTDIAEIWSGCCETVSIRNTSSQPILMKNAVIAIDRSDGYQG